MEKNKVTQDFLFKFITERGINVSTLAEQMGVSKTMVNGCFRHNKDRNGNPRSFPERTLSKLNAAITELAQQMRCSLITFGSEQTYTNNRGTTYDPATVDSIKALHKYFKLNQFLKYALGWTENKKSITLHTPSSKGFACVSYDDVEHINSAIIEVSIIFSSIEVVPDKSCPQTIKKHYNEKGSLTGLNNNSLKEDELSALEIYEDELTLTD